MWRVASRLINPGTCLECLFWSRWRLGLSRRDIEAVALRAWGRTEAFVETFREVVGRLGDPFEAVRAGLNARVAGMAEKLSWIARAGVLEALSAAAMANSVDVWVPGRELTASVSLEGGARVCCGGQIERLAGSAELVVYLLDNSGEAVVDILAAHALARGGARVVLVARSEPYEVDVTEAEAARLLRLLRERLGLRGRVEFVGTGSAYPAPALDRVDEEVVELLAAADIVVSKGIANLEALSEYCSVEPWKTVVALRAKCQPIASLLGVRVGEAFVGLGYRCLRPT